MLVEAWQQREAALMDGQTAPAAVPRYLLDLELPQWNRPSASHASKPMERTGASRVPNYMQPKLVAEVRASLSLTPPCPFLKMPHGFRLLGGGRAPGHDSNCSSRWCDARGAPWSCPSQPVSGGLGFWGSTNTLRFAIHMQPLLSTVLVESGGTPSCPRLTARHLKPPRNDRTGNRWHRPPVERPTCPTARSHRLCSLLQRRGGEGITFLVFRVARRTVTPHWQPRGPSDDAGDDFPLCSVCA